MKSRHRTLSGIIFAVFLVPFIIGLAACLPVPIGDPERSRLDADMTGVWLGFDAGVTYFEPYDKRTWLVTTVGISTPGSCMPPGTTEDYDGFIAWLEEEECASAEKAAIFKAWRSKHGKHWFLTMQPMATVDDESEDPFADEVWFVYRIDKSSADTFELLMIDPDFTGFADLPENRRAYEKVIRKHSADEDMYISGADPFIRIRDEHISLVADFVEEHIDID